MLSIFRRESRPAAAPVTDTEWYREMRAQQEATAALIERIERAVEEEGYDLTVFRNLPASYAIAAFVLKVK